jgi:hypothetical protein
LRRNLGDLVRTVDARASTGKVAVGSGFGLSERTWRS